MDNRPQFSIIHPSARPGQWRSIYDAWIRAAVDPGSVEYVLCIDDRWGFPCSLGDSAELLIFAGARDIGVGGVGNGVGNLVVWNRGRRCYVDSVNTAAAAATGRILIVIADDQYPAAEWDRALLGALTGQALPGDSFVVEVSTGTTDEHERGIMVMPILSRARYEAAGFVFYPAYESMYADNDFCEWARRDSAVVNARYLLFPHKHPINDKSVPVDEQYKVQNRREAFALGQALLERRRAAGFAPLVPAPGAFVPELGESAPRPRTIALCLTGEHFRGEWVDSILTLYNHLISRCGFEVMRLRNYTTNVYVTRAEIWEALEALAELPDYLLWVDDDNLLSPQHFDLLLAGLDGRPDLDGVTGWCWVHDREQKFFQTSCGTWAPDGVHWLPFHPLTFPRLSGLQDIEVTGFPCFLMRGSMVGKLGPRPFIRGILDDRLRTGIGGEDLAFCRACRDVARLAVDPRARVPHLKYMEVVPEFVDAGVSLPYTLAVMMRVRNEGRWIARVVESVRSLGPVYVMDDHSTDNTRELAAAAGAVVFTSPFAHEDLDERRDKNWLLERVRELSNADWVLCIDGDEELAPGGADKIARACASGRADAYSVRFLYLWDRPDCVRLDRWYSTFSRFSLFRVLPGLSFKSLYEDSGVNIHSGLHTGNAPSPDHGESFKTLPLDVFFLHYGYMVKADRIRKYEYYNRIDPNNPLEDCYRHIVQGDIPEVPADAVLKHAGPLDVRRLPASLAPKLDAEVVV